MNQELVTGNRITTAPKSSVSASESRAVALAGPGQWLARTPDRVPGRRLSPPRGHARRSAGGDDPLQTRLPQCAGHCGDMAVGSGTHDVEGIVQPTGGSFRSRRRRVSVLLWGHFGRLASVRFLTFPPSRHPSRNRMAGGEFRLGTVSMYMGTAFLFPPAISPMKSIA